ncbi:retrovirus-related pol polyprotein from transposon TNT 1-94 [Tanacetum coccineum]
MYLYMQGARVKIALGVGVGRQKACLWERIHGLKDSSKGSWCIFGDLNVVRGSEERMNSQVNIKETTDFNDFINDAKLIEIPMGGESSLGGEGYKERGGRVMEDRELSKERFGAMNEKIEMFKKEAMKWELEAENKTILVKGYAFPTIVKVRPVGCDLLVLVDGFTPVEDNIGLLETKFDEEEVFVFVFPEDVTGSVNLTLLSLFFEVTATNFPSVLLILGQVLPMFVSNS